MGQQKSKNVAAPKSYDQMSSNPAGNEHSPVSDVDKRATVGRSNSFSSKSSSLKKSLNGGVDAEGDLAAPWIHSEYQNWKNAELEAENRTLVVWATPHSGAGSAVPLQMPGGIAVLSVSCGLAHTAAVTVRGELFTWGANDFNQLGRPLPSGGGVFPVPERAFFALHLHALEPKIAAVSCGARHTLALTDRSMVLSFGDNSHGQCGYLPPQPPGSGSATGNSPVAANTTAKVSVVSETANGRQLRGAAISCGYQHSFVISVSGEVYAFGDNAYGQLGLGDQRARVGVHLVEGLLGIPVSHISAGEFHSICVTVCGNVFVWGSNALGQLGAAEANAIVPAPFWMQYFIGMGVCQVRCGRHHTFVLTKDGAAYGFGDSSKNQLSQRSQSREISASYTCKKPTLLAGFPEGSRFCDISACDTGGVALVWDPHASRRQVWCWGEGVSESSFAQLVSGWTGPAVPFHSQQAHGGGAGGAPPAFSDNVSVWNDDKLSNPYLNNNDNNNSNNSKQFPGGATHPVHVAGAPPSGSDFASAFQQLHLQQQQFRGLSGVSVAVGGGSGIICVMSDNASLSSAEVGSMCALPDAPFAHFNREAGMRMISMAKAGRSSVKLLSEYLQYVLSHPACMNASFLGREARFKQSGSVSGLEMDLVRGFLIELQSPLLYNAMLEGVGHGIQYLYDFRLAHSPEILRMFLILLDTPVLLNPDMRNRKILDQVLFCMLGLPQLLKNTLLSYIGEHAPQYFVMPVQIFERYMSFLIRSNGHEQSLQNCAVFLSFLNQINEAKRLIPFQQLYNDVLNGMPMAMLEQEYWKWRNRQFSFCQYPFLLGASSKSELLQIDAMVSMKEQVESALISSVMRGDATLPFFVLVVRRDNIIADALAQVQAKPGDLKKPLKVKFVNEEGIDAGGVKKEFFQLVVRNLLDPKYGMFVYKEETRVFWFNVASPDAPEFVLVGTMLGLAIYNSVILDLPFPLLVYKKLCGKPVTLEDVNDLDPQTYRNLCSLLDYKGDDIVDVYCLDFSVSFDYFGATKVVNLVPNGASVPVTQENKQQYVKLFVQWLLVDSVTEQFEAFARGFRMVGGPTLSIFRPEELELLVCGSQTVNIDELQASTTYKGGYGADHKVIRWFWDIVKAWPVEKQKKLLTFATGSDRVPIKGLSNIGFIIQCNTNDTSRLPTASTCFNTLLLPCYSNVQQLREKLEIAITQGNEGFGLK